MIVALWLALYVPARAAGSFPTVERSTAPISVVFPPEGMVIPPTDGEWINGSVEQPVSVFRINGAPVEVFRTGAFLAWLPVTPGTFSFHCDLTLKSGATFSYVRGIAVTPAPTPLPAQPVALDKDSLWPRIDLTLRPGDWLIARAKASPGATVKFRLPHHSWLPMRAVNPGLGLYEGSYMVQPGEDLDAEPVEFKAGWASARSAGKVALRAGPAPIAVLKGGNGGGVDLKSGYAGGELFPAYAGARFLTAGSAGSETKLLLSGGQAGWTDSKNLDLLPEGAAPPGAESDTVSIKPGEEGSSIVHISLTDRVPFEVQEADDLNSLTVRLHYTANHTNWVVHDSNEDFVSNARLRQEADGLLSLEIRLKPGRRLWGYQASYDGGGLRLELRHPPRINPQALMGRTIFLDPGHMPSAPGAIGPLGTKEMDVNYAIALEASRLLKAEGAKAILSRANEDDEVGLTDRPKQAWDKRADVFVSIHNNNLPGESNPYKTPHGYSIFYYHANSFELARDVYQAYSKLVPLPGEMLRFGNLLVARQTAMPAILTESAYMTYPDQEALLLDPAFRHKLAEAMVAGLRTFLERARSREAEAPVKHSGGSTKGATTPKASKDMKAPQNPGKRKKPAQ